MRLNMDSVSREGNPTSEGQKVLPRILLINDNPDLLEPLGETLNRVIKKAMHIYTNLGQAKNAIKKSKNTSPYDIIITTTLEGIETLKMLRMPLIFIDTSGEPLTPEEMEKKGISGQIDYFESADLREEINDKIFKALGPKETI